MEATFICAFHVCNAASVPPSISHGFCFARLVKEWSVCAEGQLIAGLYARGCTQHRLYNQSWRLRLGKPKALSERTFYSGEEWEEGKAQCGWGKVEGMRWYWGVTAWVCQSAEQRLQAGVSWLIWVVDYIICWNILWRLKNGGIEIKLWISDSLLKIRKSAGRWRCTPWEEEVGRSWGQRGL